MSRRAAITDIAVVLLVALSYVVLEALHVPKRWSYAGAGVALIAFGLFIWRRRPDSWRDLGFRTDNLRTAVVPIGLITLGFATALIVWALVAHRMAWSRESTLLLLLYPAWALVQQGVFQGILHRRLAAVWPSAWGPVLTTALAFAAVHWGNGLLVGLTLGAGLAWSVLYRYWPNLWLLAIAHSVLAALAYPAVLGDAPLSRF
jgi:membrane protease YdiL (CAAX protease family)